MNKKDIKKILKSIPVKVFLIFTIGLLTIPFLNFMLNERNESCMYSQYNPSNYSYARRFLDRCLVKTSGWVEIKKECGLFGISCYELSEPRQELIYGEYCFKLKDGSMC